MVTYRNKFEFKIILGQQEKYNHPEELAEGGFLILSETAGKQVRFENCDLKGTLFSNCDLANVEIANCNVSGMKINGIDVKDLFNAYSKAVGNENG